ncbi:HDOD domain-containing protein [Bermanella marisrubri]|uniref:HDOD domain-containing protein n=2 Tax=Bermanella marisrubri TaxID=207949 RepID=Q1N613_9GAMM|nr:hypothetical protein RED65_10314 [Oceanobacter sp. RED65] [Bermanella marisrubri]QIZ84549.1 HDOD domain-containing protein [Bermanella marisrubri]
MLELTQLMKDDDLELTRLAALIKQDVALYSALLAAVNSPWMGLPESVDCIENAVTIMGMSKVVSLIQAMTVRTTFKNVPLLESFWESAAEVASISDFLAKRYRLPNADQAYTSGMLHNAGVAIMIQSLPEYKTFFDTHGKQPTHELCALERQHFSTDHFFQGAMLTKKWFMPGEVALSIRYQPIAHSVLTGKKTLPTSVADLLAILVLAKSISQEYQNYWKVEKSDLEQRTLLAALDYLEIHEVEFNELREDLLESMSNSAVA